MPTLITGAETMLGAHVALQLLENGFVVRALAPGEGDLPALRGRGAEIFPGNLLQVESVAPALEGVTAVFHCSMDRSIRPEANTSSREINARGTRNLLIAMTRSGVEEMVQVGSAFSFGGGGMEDPGTEETPYDGERFGLSCLDSCRAAQELALRFNEDGKVRCVLVNPTLAIGAGGNASPSATLFKWVRSGARRFPPGGINVVDARDVARAAVRALGRGRPGNCYILGGENLSYHELLTRVASATGLPAPDLPATGRSMLAGARALSALGRVARRKPLLGPGLALLAASEMYYSSEKAARELGFSASPIDAAVLLQSRRQERGTM